MRIPDGIYFAGGPVWQNKADKLSMKHGVFIEVGFEYEVHAPLPQQPYTQSVYGTYGNGAITAGGLYPSTYISYNPIMTTNFGGYEKIKRVFFKLGGHEFENLIELKKAIKNKLFL